MEQTTRNLQSLVVFLQSLNGWGIKAFDGPGRLIVEWADPDIDDQTNWCCNDNGVYLVKFQCPKRTPTAEKVMNLLGVKPEDITWWKVKT